MKFSRTTMLSLVLIVLSLGVFVYTYVGATVTTDMLPIPGGTASSALPAQPVSGIAVAHAQAPAPLVVAPTLLAIPSLKIRAQVVEVGVTASGAMATPASYSQVGWYKDGTLPGDMGSAVLAGHVDNGLALAGVFKHLNQIKKGDLIDVTLSSGELKHFVVTDVAVYDYKQAPVQEIFGQDDDRYLRLITCTGTLIKKEHTYDKRLVVTAVLK